MGRQKVGCTSVFLESESLILQPVISGKDFQKEKKQNKTKTQRSLEYSTPLCFVLNAISHFCIISYI